MFNSLRNLEIFIAWRFLRGKKRNSFISVVNIFSLLGILLGVATLIIVMSVMNGFRIELFAKLNGIHGHIKAYSRVATNDKEFISEIKKDGFITFSAPLIQDNALVANKKRASGGIVRGIDSNYLKARKSLNINLKGNTVFSQFNNNEAVALLGYRLAKNLNLKKGDKVTIISPEGNIGAFGTVPKFKTFRLVGTINSGLYDADNAYVFIPRSIAQKLFNRNTSYDYVELLIDDPASAKDKADLLEKRFGNSANFFSWYDFNNTFFEALQTERNVMFIILSLIIIVAAFNIISGQIMLIADKEQNIAILRGMGMTRNSILRIFFFTGAFNGVIGSVIGVGVALLLLMNLESLREFLSELTNTTIFPAEIYYLSELPSDLRASDVAIVTSIALGLTFLASFYPAWRAARLDPVEILRHAQ